MADTFRPLWQPFNLSTRWSHDNINHDDVDHCYESFPVMLLQLVDSTMGIRSYLNTLSSRSRMVQC